MARQICAFFMLYHVVDYDMAYKTQFYVQLKNNLSVILSTPPLFFNFNSVFVYHNDLLRDSALVRKGELVDGGFSSC